MLDVGCGPWALTEALAAALGQGPVAAIDPSEPFLEVCRSREPGADIRVGTAENLHDFGATFGAVMSQLVVNFMMDALAGVHAMRAVARPGGLVTSCVWNDADAMTMLRTFWDAALELDPEASDQGRTMRYCSKAELRRLWSDCGLRGIETGELVVKASYEGFAGLWRPSPTGLGPSWATARRSSRNAGTLSAKPSGGLGRPTGSFTLTARAWFVKGRAQRSASTRSRAAPVPTSVTGTPSASSTYATYDRAAAGRSSSIALFQPDSVSKTGRQWWKSL